MMFDYVAASESFGRHPLQDVECVQESLSLPSSYVINTLGSDTLQPRTSQDVHSRSAGGG